MPGAPWMAPLTAWLDAGTAVEKPEAPAPKPEPDPTPAPAPGAGESMPAAPSAAEPEPDAPLTPDQDRQIRAMVSRLVKRGFSVDEFKTEWLPVWGAKQIADLTGVQAVDCIARLALEDQKQATTGKN